MQAAAGAQRQYTVTRPPPTLAHLDLPTARKKKKTKGQASAAPKPYLALAPNPISTLTQEEIEAMASRSMVLPSTYVRTSKPSTSQVSATGPFAPAKKKKYAAGLLAPPAIMPGGQTARPRLQSSNSAGAVPRRSSERVETLARPERAERQERGDASRATSATPGLNESRRRPLDRTRSSDRLRDIGGNNASMMSLGHLGQIFGSDPMAQTPPAAPAPEPQQRRRRRVVRGEEGGRPRRPTVSSREEGRAMGLARGASMRRMNVWDGKYSPLRNQEYI